MSLAISQASPFDRTGEVALWGSAGLIVLALHVGAAGYLLQRQPEALADNSPPAAIMIELAPEPEAANTEAEQVSDDRMDQQLVESQQPEPVEEPPQPVEEPMPEPIETPPPEPVIEEPLPEPEVTETIPEPLPDPVEEIDPLEQQMTAALENVDVPLPATRPQIEAKPEEARKPEPRKEPVRKVEKPKPVQPQAREDMAQAKIEARQSDRTAATQTSTGFFSRSESPAKWMSRVRTKIARYARSCPGNSKGIVTVRFSFDGSGNIGGVSVARSSGDSAMDAYVVSAVQKASPIPAPPSGIGTSLSQPVTCK